MTTKRQARRTDAHCWCLGSSEWWSRSGLVKMTLACSRIQPSSARGKGAWPPGHWERVPPPRPRSGPAAGTQDSCRRRSPSRGRHGGRGGQGRRLRADGTRAARRRYRATPWPAPDRPNQAAQPVWRSVPGGPRYGAPGPGPSRATRRSPRASAIVTAAPAPAPAIAAAGSAETGPSTTSGGVPSPPVGCLCRSIVVYGMPGNLEANPERGRARPRRSSTC